MNIAVLNEKISKINYVIENPNQIIDNLISLYINNDKSLIQNDYETNKYENDKYFDSLNKERLITIFNKILIKNADKIDFEHFKKMVLFVKEKLIWDNKFVDYVFRFVTNYKEEEILEILNYVKEDLSVNIWIVINKLFNINKINIEFMRKILDLADGVSVEDYEFEYLLPKLSQEYILLIFNYDSNIINLLKPDQVTSEMIEKVKNDNSFILTNNSPHELFEDRKYLEKAVRLNPNLVKRIDGLLSDRKLLELAIQNGLELNYDDFKNKGLFNLKILIKELDSYFSNVYYKGGVITKIILNGENVNISHIYELLKYAIENNYIVDVLNYLADKNGDALLNDFKKNNLNIDFILSNQDIMLKLIKTLNNEFANSILFEPNDEFIKKYFEAGYCVTAFSSEMIKNSLKIFLTSLNYEPYQIASVLKNCKSEFVTKDFIDKAIIKGLNILEDGLYEITDVYLKEDVLKSIANTFEGSYKEFIKTIIQKAGYSIYYVERDNLLREEIFKAFGEEFVTKLVRNLAFCGEKLPLKNLIEKQQLELFKTFYDMEKVKGDALEFQYLLNVFIENEELISELINSGMNEEEREGLREYIYHKDKLFKISSKKYLLDMKNTIFMVNEKVMKEDPDNAVLLKCIIFSTLFGVGYNEVDNLLGIVKTQKLDSLRNNITNKEHINFINQIRPYIGFIEFVNKCYDSTILMEIANRANLYFKNFPNEVYEIKKIFGNLNELVKIIYAEELNNSLTKLSDDSYVEFEEDSYFLAHVMNAFGSGSKLSDFKNPRFIGKTYICLTAIGDGVEPYKREEKDMNHVTLLFNRIPPKSLISMSSHDMFSQGDNGQMNVRVNNDFDILKNILENTNDVNEYVVYREDEDGLILYPCGVLVVGETPSLPEMEAAKYLGVPLVKRKTIAKVKKENTSEVTIGDNLNQSWENEFYQYLMNRVNSINDAYKL